MALLGILTTEPMHPYAIQRRIKEWGKDKVVNVTQRAALYKTITRLRDAGLVTVRETERDQQYPERTVYEITEAGRAACHAWVAEILGQPRNEFPEFPAALSFLLLLGPHEAEVELQRRAEALRAELSDIASDLAQATAMNLPPVVMLEDQYLHAVTETELRWLEGVIADLADGTLTWTHESLTPHLDRTIR
jgi:DNA-binding PadR family transcriptional regulator